MSENRTRIEQFTALLQKRPHTVRELADTAGVSFQYAWKLMRRLRNAGCLEECGTRANEPGQRGCGQIIFRWYVPGAGRVPAASKVKRSRIKRLSQEAVLAGVASLKDWIDMNRRWPATDQSHLQETA